MVENGLSPKVRFHMVPTCFEERLCLSVYVPGRHYHIETHWTDRETCRKSHRQHPTSCRRMCRLVFPPPPVPESACVLRYNRTANFCLTHLVQDNILRVDQRVGNRKVDIGFASHQRRATLHRLWSAIDSIIGWVCSFRDLRCIFCEEVVKIALGIDVALVLEDAKGIFFVTPAGLRYIVERSKAGRCDSSPT